MGAYAKGLVQAVCALCALVVPHGGAIAQDVQPASSAALSPNAVKQLTISGAPGTRGLSGVGSEHELSCERKDYAVQPIVKGIA